MGPRPADRHRPGDAGADRPADQELPGPLTADRRPAAHTTARGRTRAAETPATRPNPPSARRGPPTTPATAAPRPISRSVPPWAVGRSSGPTDSGNRGDHAISGKDQPSPRSSSPAPSWTAAPGAAVPASVAAARSSTPPTAPGAGGPAPPGGGGARGGGG